MSIYAKFDNDGAMPQIASNLGWSQFIEWADTLDADKCLNVVQLAEHGGSEDLPALRSQLEGAMESDPPQSDVEGICDELLSALDENQEASVILITDGTQPDEAD